MAYAFRKFYSSNSYYNTVPTPTVGQVITFDPNANPYDYVQNSYGNIGLFLYAVNSYLGYMEGDTLVVVSYDPANTTNVGDPTTIIASTFTIEYVAAGGIDATFKSYFDLTQLTSSSAYTWGLVFQDYDDVIQYVTDQGDMSAWVSNCRYSDYAHFAPFIVDQQWIYYWATQFDDASFFAKLTDQSLLLSYAMYFPDREATVKPLITDPYWQGIWNLNFPQDPIIEPSPTPDASGTPEASPTPEPTPTMTVTPEVTPTPSVTQTPV